MLTFQNMYEEVQEQVQDDNTVSLTSIKRAINQGAKKFANVLNREWRTSTRTFSTVANQQLYQLPEDCIKLRSITVTVGGNTYPLTEVVDEGVWRDLNLQVDTSSIPEVFFVEGNDQIGIYPIPSASVSNNATIRYEASIRDMTAADYTTGTIALTNGSATVTGTATVFTANMVGRVLFVTDGSPDGMGYKISAYTSATVITLENLYGGSTTASTTYKIGEVADIPEEFHESLIDYGCYRYYLRRKNRTLARDFKSLFDAGIDECKLNYSSKTTSQYFRPIRAGGGYTHRRRDYTVS